MVASSMVARSSTERASGPATSCVMESGTIPGCSTSFGGAQPDQIVLRRRMRMEPQVSVPFRGCEAGCDGCAGAAAGTAGIARRVIGIERLPASRADCRDADASSCRLDLAMMTVLPHAAFAPGTRRWRHKPHERDRSAVVACRWCRSYPSQSPGFHGAGRADLSTRVRDRELRLFQGVGLTVSRR